MILSLCPNPSLDVYYYTQALKEDDTTRVENPFLSPGGKGVNAARVIARFCQDSYLALPLGGCTGECIKGMLEEEGVNSIIVETTSTTRVNTILEQRAKGKHILLAARGEPLTQEEQEKLNRAVCWELEPRVLILGGSVPPHLPNTYYREIILNYRGSETKIVVDADGELLKKAVEAAPFAIKPNKHELERLVGRPLMETKDFVKAAKEVVETGPEVVIVSLGEFGAICVTEEKAFRVIPPKVEVKNTVGAGDSLVGGFAYAIYSGEPLERAVAFGVACGTATVTREGTKLCTPELVEEILRKTAVEEIN
ncbi:1-phosphofructokinase family hexose kinase [Thermovibrio ammonificans]|jgi:1-phosphofructokinase family hexose kinase|uniref:1-phosphofructokinase n=1 Tax=Thermovibrio ammonificans (strain DSM 15698 / JCM 12110 / HB-1) TaxID=648996 RepID=E8T4X7_THEA1|nr:1-phosphofructokinase family hexose kinase [Thermovibrio ammonificans]ADU97509.1 1-phosphofructokinase [Thermovibrio ammonificans HB-1]